MKKAAQLQAATAADQFERSFIPRVLLVDDAERKPGQQIDHYMLKNVGQALNKRSKLANWLAPVDSQALAAGESSNTIISPNALFTEDPLRCIFESLSGVTYETESSERTNQAPSLTISDTSFASVPVSLNHRRTRV
jgi:hypothetical protein